jgi:hypothetical protein
MQTTAAASFTAGRFEDAARDYWKAAEKFGVALPERTPPKTTSANVEEGIRKALGEYEHALESLDAGAMAAIFPSAKTSEVEGRRKACKSFDVTFADVRIHPPAGNEAIVDVQSTYSCTPTAGKRQPPVSMKELIFFAKKETGDWYVSGTGQKDNR